MAIVRSFDSRSPPMGRPAYTENTSKWGRFEFGLLASEDAELTMPHHFEEASVYMGLARNQNLIKMTYFSQ